MERFEPDFPELSSDSEAEEGGDGVRVDELNEHRLDQRASRTAEQEVERHGDGRTVTTSKLSSSSSSKTSQSVSEDRPNLKMAPLPCSGPSRSAAARCPRTS